ncbi:four-carbon acid sugar kinase family protein [Candidimonas sp. SYP-B2681]|uniref:3-oxo-tetronate kinase n=1 Tax=Candidimonas sp. SYP-B2681 TaxID=2497686 RepID=UPI000F85F884|nr:3-oxo-tetronate kinase [Candidimonas sp. SYP-B2681]RTZ41633.1 four-carbon acid sugar kinase family protein [Candidimonas sp. SYP-B2681]
MMGIKLGCIADDFTGATDLANNLVQSGMRVLQAIGVPPGPVSADVDAVVIALKSRTAPKLEAISDSLAALRWLQAQGAQQIYFKYCSTFDSTSDGNIGPVTEALMDALTTDFTVATPAFPDNKRTVFKAYLFVGDVLLHESGMQNHPLTPMTDPNLMRVLQSQCSRKVGLIDYSVVQAGPQAIQERIETLRADGVGIAIVDALTNQDLINMGPAFKHLPLLTAGSGLAIGLAQNFGLSSSKQSAALPAVKGTRAIVSGSCSVATNAQVARFIKSGHAAIALDPMQLVSDGDVVDRVLSQVLPLLESGPVLIYSTADADAIKAVQAKLGVAKAGAMIEAAIAAIACGLVKGGVGQLIVAGGETSGACVGALGITQMQIGGQIDPGVPWCYAPTEMAPHHGIHIALKSGNFGSDDFFEKAFAEFSL